MVPESAVDSHSPDEPSPASSGSAAAGVETEEANSPPKTKPASNQKNDTQFPPSKTDKPKPHVCQNCGRPFARLEHLKRHERSHTKEKPFECPECTRCFARRDLLLRHQQKLHFQNNSSARSRTGRRESVSGTATTGSGRVRKNSIANNNVGGSKGVGNVAGRPRANTVGHIDLASLGLIDNDGKQNRMSMLGLGHSSRLSMGGLQTNGNHSLHDLASHMDHNAFGNLPKLETNNINHNIMDGSLRTAPAYAGSGGFDFDQLFPSGPGNTINPAQLHFPGATASPSSPFPSFPQFDTVPDTIDQVGDDFSWMRNWDGMQSNTTMSNEHVIDESSSSHISSASQAGFPDGTRDMQNGFMPTAWPSTDMTTQSMLAPAAFHLSNLGTGLPSLNPPPGTISPQTLHGGQSNEAYFHNGMGQNGHHSQSDPFNVAAQAFAPPAPMSNFGSDSPSISSSMTGSARQSSVTSVSTASITDATRQALMISLSQPSVFGNSHRKYSQPSISSPLSPGGAIRAGPMLPSTTDLQRYVSAYIQYFHPHLPFLHIPTLTFDSSDYISNLRSANVSFGQAGIIGGGGCLILAMAAIGALYEYDHQASRDLFDSAKRMIQLYLEERRKSDMSAAVNGSYVGHGNSLHNTPLWLVQAMLLNVIYGHNCGDKTSSDIASTHCAALVSLARAAELARPMNDGSDTFDMHHGETKLHDGHNQPPQSASHLAWCKWKDAEERKRTLFAVFTLSSLLVTAYNHTPAIMNSEILLDLPCEEDLWAAESAHDWLARGGSHAAEHNAMPFSMALSTLLTANQRTSRRYSVHAFGPQAHTLSSRDSNMDAELRPSTFGCLILINALHNYIWETRSRHHGRQWTPQETESMFSHIEPALNAWQAAWKANDYHRLHRPNPFGLGPLSADSIPLLDLAFVRLFVNLGRSKEAFWQRDFESMANELARGTEIIQHAAASPGSSSEMNSSHSPESINGVNDSPAVSARHSLRRPSQILTTGQGSKRERHLRKAAFYAADSLTISSKFALTYADATSHELPIQSAMCFFDCSQVLAEWASTIQERVGRYLGVLGREDIDYTQVPAIMLLETEDVELLNKIENICTMLEEKMIQQANMLARELGTLESTSPMSMLPNPVERLNGLRDCGLGAKILRVTAYMLEKAAVWPVTHVMANALEVQATQMGQRAEASLSAA